VTGDNGDAREDRACADYIAELVAGRDPDPGPYFGKAAESMAAADLKRAVELGYRGVHRDHVSRCLQVTHYPFAMLAEREEPGLVLRAAA
jgi:2-phosphosulfolactate phosphatase